MRSANKPLRATASAALALALGVAALTARPATAAGDGLSVQYRTSATGANVKDQVLTPAQVAAKVTAYRGAGTTFEDTVPSS
ncbi:hypothetical protein [Streptomyces sp. YIM S03343]